MNILLFPFKAFWWLITAEWMKYTASSWKTNGEWWKA